MSIDITQVDETIDISIYNNLKENIDHIRETLGNGSDIVIRNFSIGEVPVECAIVYIDGMTDRALIDENILRRLMLILDQLRKVK